jgi:hypothetical protein
MQQTILQLGIFKKLGTLQSSSRFIDARVRNNEAEKKIGELVFNSNFKNENPNLRSGLNATEVTYHS